MTNKPCFIIAELPADDATQVEYRDRADASDLRDQLAALRASLEEAGYDFDIVFISPKIGIQPVIDALDKAKHCNGVIIGYGVRGNKAPQVTVFLEELIERLRKHPKNVKILFNWSAPPSLDACRRALGEEA